MLVRCHVAVITQHAGDLAQTLTLLSTTGLVMKARNAIACFMWVDTAAHSMDGTASLLCSAPQIVLYKQAQSQQHSTTTLHTTR